MIGAESVIILPVWEPLELLVGFGAPLAIESLITLEAAGTVALLGLPLIETSGSRIGDESVAPPSLLDERRYRGEGPWISIAIAVCHSPARFNKTTSSVDANRKHGRGTKLMKLNKVSSHWR